MRKALGLTLAATLLAIGPLTLAAQKTLTPTTPEALATQYRQMNRSATVAAQVGQLSASLGIH